MKVVQEGDLPLRSLVGRMTVVLLGPGSGSKLLTHSVAYFEIGHAPGHTHVSDEVFFVDQGAGEVWLNGVPYALRPGTVVYTPGDVEHSVHTLPDRPMRLVAFASPHMIPGSYADLAPRSRDLAVIPTATSPLVTYEPKDPVTRNLLGLSVATDRIEVVVRRMACGEITPVAARNRDVVLNILDGEGELRYLGTSIPLPARTAILMTGAESGVLVANADLRYIEGRTTGWRPTSNGESRKGQRE